MALSTEDDASAVTATVAAEAPAAPAERVPPNSATGTAERKVKGKKGYETVTVDYDRVRDLLASSETDVPFVAPSGAEAFWTKLKLAFALPWRRFKGESVLVLKVGGSLSDKQLPRFGAKGQSLPELAMALRKAALDPRVVGVAVKVEPLSVGWAKLQELSAHLDHFRASGKFSMSYLELGGEKEYYLASACDEVYVPESASLSLRGLSVSGSFLREAFEKAGVEPEVRRIGKYKSAGDQLLRRDMSEPQREQLTALLDDIFAEFVSRVAARRGKTEAEVLELIDRGEYDMAALAREGWVTGLRYETDVEDLLKGRTGGKEDQVRQVGYKKYRKVSPTAFGIGAGKKAVAVVRASGGITNGSASDQGITAKKVIGQLRRLRKDPRVAAVVLRVDSPGGDALASDLMWDEIRRMSKEKPIVASMADTAASGGYYMAMGCERIVAEPLTITGSVGVVTGKFNLEGLYGKIGLAKEVISRGKYAQVLSDNRALSDAEAELFDRQARFAYESFRNKAAASRGKTDEDMEEVAQGRVWTGRAALGIGLVDGLGGVARAVEVAKALAGIEDGERVRVLEVSKAEASPLQLLQGGAAAAAALAGALSPEGLRDGLLGAMQPADALLWDDEGDDGADGAGLAALAALAARSALAGAAAGGSAQAVLPQLLGGAVAGVPVPAAGAVLAVMEGADELVGGGAAGAVVRAEGDMDILA